MSQENIPVGRSPTKAEEEIFTKEEEFYFQWARENLKSSISLANDILKQLVTLNAALLGGSSVLLSKEIIDSGPKIVVVALFAIALVVSFLGVLPYEAAARTDYNEIKKQKMDALVHKRWFIRIGSGFSALSFGVGIFFIIAKAL